MIEVSKDELLIEFPEVHPKAKCRVTFLRTLRVPDDGETYHLPAGLGCFPLTPVEDTKLSNADQKRGGVVLPMYEHEAMWIDFDAQYPFAVKVAAGKINALTGAEWENELSSKEQDYLVLPDQPWLDGFSVEKDVVRQFVATTLGSGETVEEQLTGKAEFGGIQLIFYPMKPEHYALRVELLERASQERFDAETLLGDVEDDQSIKSRYKQLRQAQKRIAKGLEELKAAQLVFAEDQAVAKAHERHTKMLGAVEQKIELLEQLSPYLKTETIYKDKEIALFRDYQLRNLGLGLGGKISQEIYKDRWGVEAWQSETFSRCFVHLVDSTRYQTLTGKRPPNSPITVSDYEDSKIPWFDYKDSLETTNGSRILKRLKSLVEFKREKTGLPATSEDGLQNLVVRVPPDKKEVKQTKTVVSRQKAK